MTKIVKVFAEKSTPNCKLYIITGNDFLYDYSWKKNAIIDVKKFEFQISKKDYTQLNIMKEVSKVSGLKFTRN